MAYHLKLDDNLNPVDIIDGVVPVFVDTTSTGVKEVDIPNGSFTIGVKRCPVEAELSINGSDYFPTDEGDALGKFRSLQSVKIRVNTVGTSPVVLLFTV